MRVAIGPKLVSTTAQSSADLVAQTHALFEQTLTGWASDWLHLMARGLDRPTMAGRNTPADDVRPISARRTPHPSDALLLAMQWDDLDWKGKPSGGRLAA